MTHPEMPVTEDELHAFVDNELPAERRATSRPGWRRISTTPNAWRRGAPWA
jgi:anti-sigma factor RsiW